MSFRLYPLPESKLDNIRPLFDKMDAEMVTPKLANVDHVMRSVRAGYDSRTLSVFVDDVQEPKHGVMLTTVPSIWMEGLSVAVLWIYSTPEERGDKEKLDAMDDETLESIFKSVTPADYTGQGPIDNASGDNEEILLPVGVGYEKKED